MSPVSAVLDRLRSAARRPSTPLGRPAAVLLGAGVAALDADHWHAGDARPIASASAARSRGPVREVARERGAGVLVRLPAPRRVVDLRTLDAPGLVGAAVTAPAPQPAPLPRQQGHPRPPEQSAQHAEHTRSWAARPGPTTWFG